MHSGPLSAEQIARYEHTGYLLVDAMFDAEEIGLLAPVGQARTGHSTSTRSAGTTAKAGKVRLSLWNHPGDGIYGMFARCRRIVDACEQILDDEVYHYHSKMIMKDAKVGGAWTWHQDYGYWYQNGVLFPDLVSVFIAVDPSTRQNGCLQVIEGSHRLGRIDHVLTGDQAGADLRAGREDPRAAAAGPRRDEARRRAFLPSQPAAPLRPEHLDQPALEHDLLLQRPPQRPLQGVAPPPLHALEQGR